MQADKYPFAQELITDTQGNIRKVVIDFNDYQHLLKALEVRGLTQTTAKTPPKSLISQEELDKFDPVKQHEALSKLMQEWEEEDDDEQEQTETWEFLRKALDEDRLSNRPLFP